MAFDSIVSAQSHGRARRDIDVSRRTVRAWPSHAICSFKSGNHWECTRRVSLHEIERVPTAALGLLSSIEADFVSATRTSSASSDWAMMASIPAMSPNGFDIDVRIDSVGICASFGGLNQEFDQIASAMVWVRRALSRQYQLRIVCLGGLAREWRLEPISSSHQNSEWLASGHPIRLRRWRRTSLIYRCNRLLDLTASGYNDN